VLIWKKSLMVKKMAQIKVTQVRSTINRPARQVRTMEALGLGKINRTVVHTANSQIIGMVKQVSHLVKVEEA
jgi:large subunit ribosomal protein L30